MTDVTNVRPWEIPTKLARVQQAYRASTPVARVSDGEQQARVEAGEPAAVLSGNDERVAMIREMFDSNEPRARSVSADPKGPALGRFVDVTA